VVSSGNGERQEIKFVNTLKEDLNTLGHSWQNKNLDGKKVVKHFLEILNSLSDIAEGDSFEPAFAELEEYLGSVRSGKADLWEGAWNLTGELMDLLCDSLREGSVATDSMQELHSRIMQETHARITADQKTADASGSDGAKTLDQEEKQMADDTRIDPKELLAKAQEALLSGEGENAKEFALKAVQLIAEVETEEAKKREKALRTDLDSLVHEEAEAETFLSETREKTAQMEEELAAFNKRLADAESAFEKRESECREVKKEIEDAEAEMNSLKEKHKELKSRFQEVLPARDAAQRECSKIRGEAGEMPSEVEVLKESLQEAEGRLEEIRKRKPEIETEMAKLAEKLK
jgi:DNA repair exonuclease SbcCD ATPase subunit